MSGVARKEWPHDAVASQHGQGLAEAEEGEQDEEQQEEGVQEEEEEEGAVRRTSDEWESSAGGGVRASGQRLVSIELIVGQQLHIE